MKKQVMSHSTIKALSAGLISASLNAYMSYGSDLNSYRIGQSLIFGGIVGGSIYATDEYIAPKLSSHHMIPDTNFYSGKTLETRLIEVGTGSSASLFVNKTFANASMIDLVQQVGIVVLSDVVGEYIADYSTNTKL